MATAQAPQKPVLHLNDYYEADNARLNNIQSLYVLASFVSGSYQNSQTVKMDLEQQHPMLRHILL